MKTISLRELHNHTGKWVRAAHAGLEITVTDRGTPIGILCPPRSEPSMKIDWKNRDFVPGYAALMKAGKLKSRKDSSIGISEDRSSRDNSVAGLAE